MSGQTQKPKTLQARILSGKFCLAFGFGTGDRNQPRLQHCSRAIPRPEGLRARDCGLHLLTLISAVTLSFQIICRKVRGASKVAGGKIRRLPGFPSGALGRAAYSIALIVARISDGDYQLSESAQSRACCHFSRSALHFMFLWEAGEDTSRALRLRRLADNLVLEGAVAAGWIAAHGHARLRRQGRDRGQCRRDRRGLSCHRAELAAPRFPTHFALGMLFAKHSRRWFSFPARC